MKDEQKSFPVRYMPVADEFVGGCYDILDTLGGGIVATAFSQSYAYAITKFLNEAEGYRYEY